jgi:cobalt transporter subunit CbtA
MLSRVLWVGLLAGIVAGLLIAILQQVTTTPLILLAETYEAKSASASAASSAEAAKAHDHDAHDHGAHDHGWSPGEGLPRFFFTAVTTIATAIGISFLLIGGMIFAGDSIDERSALAWAIAGFVATGLAPAAGLAPELPGSAAGELLARQVWWTGTAAATAVALWGFLRMRHPAARLGAIVLLLAPHVIGAPHAHVFESKVPAEIAAQFAALSLVVQGLLWMLAGIAVGLLWPRFAPYPATRPASP